MRIAQVAPLYESVPPQLYGGTERVVSYLTEALVEMGHEVTLFASADSVTRAKLVPACGRSLWNDPTCRETLPHHVRLMDMVFQDVSRFDVVHFHTDYLHFPLLRQHKCRSVTTIHGRLHLPDLKPLFDAYPEVPLVSISNSQRVPLPDANWLATVYHGLPNGLHTFQSRPDKYLAFLGRISPEKRLDRAIEIARLSGSQLRVAAKIYPEEREYYSREIEPLLAQHSSFVQFVGEVGGREKDQFLGDASALVFPIDWAEPFGLVMIEALACGTPVIAWRNGSVPEIIEDGVTGFLVEDIEAAVRAVGKIANLSRQQCRKAFEERFDISRMAANYVEVYRHTKHSQADAIEQSRVALRTAATSSNMGPTRSAHTGLFPTPRFKMFPPWRATERSA
jgi:glycosyltransferase involved in cell wall biosynthesis